MDMDVNMNINTNVGMGIFIGTKIGKHLCMVMDMFMYLGMQQIIFQLLF